MRILPSVVKRRRGGRSTPGGGTVFKIDSTGKETALRLFPGTKDGSTPLARPFRTLLASWTERNLEATRGRCLDKAEAQGYEAVASFCPLLGGAHNGFWVSVPKGLTARCVKQCRKNVNPFV